MTEDIDVGDIVMLNSGGPPMTVTQRRDNLSRHVTCVWYDAGGKLQTVEIPSACLMTPRATDCEDAALRVYDDAYMARVLIFELFKDIDQGHPGYVALVIGVMNQMRASRCRACAEAMEADAAIPVADGVQGR